MDENKTEATEGEALPSDYLAETTFSDLPLSPAILQAIEERGYETPTPVQARSIPRALEGLDLIVRSKTGTGKTAAFSIPILEKIPEGARKPMALVLCPTRELALQVAQEAEALGKRKGIRVAAIYGGASMTQQIRALEEGAEMIVGTPGRVYDHIRRRTLDLSAAKFAVLDEADEMLSMGFFEEVTRILDKLPKKRQTFLFSATVSPDIERIVSKYLVEPETLLLSGDTYTVEGIEHVAYDVVESYPKPRNLIYLLELENPESAIIFANTRDDTAMVNAVLNRNGYDADVLSGDLPQKERERVMAKVKRGEVRYLVATDLAARGIDISGLTHVVNYSLPEDPAVYLHRVGRTGRIGKTGVAISLIGGRDHMALKSLQQQYDIEFQRRKLPTAEEARKLWTERHVTELRQEMGKSVFEAFIPLAQELRQRPDGDLLTAAVLKYFFAQKRKERAAAAEVEESREAPQEAAPAKSRRRRGEREERPEREPRERRDHGERREPRREPRAAEEEAPLTSMTGTQPPAAAPLAEVPEAPPSEELRDEGELKLYVSLGTEDELDEAAIRAKLVELAKAEDEQVLRVDVRDSFSFVTVDKDAAAAFLSANGSMIGEEELRVERAKPPRRGRRRGPSGGR